METFFWCMVFGVGVGILFMSAMGWSYNLGRESYKKEMVNEYNKLEARYKVSEVVDRDL